MSDISEGVYAIQLPNSDTCITDPGEGRYLNVLPKGSFGPDAYKIRVRKESGGVYSLQFTASKKFITYNSDAGMNNKLVDGDKPKLFKIQKHEYYPDTWVITAAENQTYHVGLALERIYPPWVALSSFPERQAWSFVKELQSML
ncbi:hypothetical protein R6Q59_010101 [Mikania micrantha]